MSTLLVWREKLQRIYALYSIYIQKGLQFVTGLVLFWVINSNIGFMKPASSVFCTLGLAVICTFLPMTITVLAATALILAHFYALSLPIALVALVIFILMYIFYFRFTPKKACFYAQHEYSFLFQSQTPLTEPETSLQTDS